MDKKPLTYSNLADVFREAHPIRPDTITLSFDLQLIVADSWRVFDEVVRTSTDRMTRVLLGRRRFSGNAHQRRIANRRAKRVRL